VERKLLAPKAKSSSIPSDRPDEKAFRWMPNETSMATDNSRGHPPLRSTADARKLEKLITVLSAASESTAK